MKFVVVVSRTRSGSTSFICLRVQTSARFKIKVVSSKLAKFNFRDLKRAEVRLSVIELADYCHTPATQPITATQHLIVSYFVQDTISFDLHLFLFVE